MAKVVFVPIRRETNLMTVMGEEFDLAVEDAVGFGDGRLGIPRNVIP